MIMKNIHKIIVFPFVLIMVLVQSCSDDFTDETSAYTIDSESYFNAEEDYYNALVGAYDLLQSTYVNAMLGEIASDNTESGGESATDVPGFQQIDDMEHTEVNSNLKDIWDWMFAGVNRANYILQFQNNDVDFEAKNQIIAEARFLRAYYNFELVKWFGAIPFKIDERFNVGDETSEPRKSKEAVYSFIQQDLLFASENLSEIAPEVGRATKGAAQALLGKAYLYDKKYSQAKDTFDEVINSGNYQLELDYSIIFETEGENGVGSVFEIQYTDVEGAGFGCLQCSEGNVAVGFNGVRNYVGPLYDSGFSFNVPTQDVLDAFEDDDIRKEVAILDIEAWKTAVEDYVTGDFDGFSWSEELDLWKTENPDVEVSYGIGNEEKHTGLYNRKYIARKGDLNTGDQNLTNPNNYRAIRFADVLLMSAEAHVEATDGNQALALEYLNRVRNRAGLDDKDLSGTTILEAIYQERRVELVGEGHRFFDLVRTERASSQIIEGFEIGKNEVFPIPFEEIQFSNGNWIQNEGYTN